MANHLQSTETIEQELSFEVILGRLQAIVDTLEKGDLPLEKSLTMFEEGVRLSRLGTARLDDAERRIDWLLSDPNTDDQSETA